MGAASSIESEVSHLIVETLNLEDVSAQDIAPDEALFGDGLGLDSIDALELALAVSTNYGVQLRAEDADNEKIFASLRSLARHIEQHRTK